MFALDYRWRQWWLSPETPYRRAYKRREIMALQAIIPSDPLIDVSIMEKELMQAINQTIQLVDSDFQKTIATWNTDVVFLVKTAARKGDSLEGSVTTSSKIYKYVAMGTKPHVIKPKNAKVLKFKSIYKPKTRINTIGSSTGGASGDDVFSQGVQHPGTEARNFHLEIAKRRQTNIQNYMTAAVMHAIKASRKGFK